MVVIQSVALSLLSQYEPSPGSKSAEVAFRVKQNSEVFHTGAHETFYKRSREAGLV